MTKKISLQTITDPNFGWAISKLITYPLPIKASYWLSKIFKKVQQAEKNFTAAKDLTLKKYVNHVTSIDGSTVFQTDDTTKEYIWIAQGYREKFLAEVEDLLKEEVEIPTMKFTLLGDDLKIESSILILLESIIIQDDLESSY